MGVAQRKTDALRFDAEIRARCPAAMVSATDKAAIKNLMSTSEYVRRCIIDRLRADGVEVDVQRCADGRVPLIHDDLVDRARFHRQIDFGALVYFKLGTVSMTRSSIALGSAP